MTNRARISQKAVELLTHEQEGLHYSILIQKVQAALPDIPINTIRGAVVGLVDYKPMDVYKPARGLFQHTMYSDGAVPSDAGPSVPVVAKPKEEDFYSSFAEYLTEDLEECTKCIPLGGCKFKDKWGTPDVIGIRKSRESDIVKFPTEIITAEIKIETGSLITAFGQACSYRLFSHRSYLVVPQYASAEDRARLESLCITCGLGLILFNSHDASSPNFSIRVRATKTEPDMFYVNRNLKLIEQHFD